jgi:hypothetical protein
VLGDPGAVSGKLGKEGGSVDWFPKSRCPLFHARDKALSAARVVGSWHRLAGGGRLTGWQRRSQNLVPPTESWRLRDGKVVQEIAPQNRTTALRFRAGPPGALPFHRARLARPSPRPCRSVRLSPSARERIPVVNTAISPRPTLPSPSRSTTSSPNSTAGAPPRITSPWPASTATAPRGPTSPASTPRRASSLPCSIPAGKAGPDTSAGTARAWLAAPAQVGPPSPSSPSTTPPSSPSAKP